MIDYKEFKIRNSLDRYLYSIIFLSSTDANKKINIYPDGCDYIIYSSLGYHGVIKKSLNLQKFSIDKEELILLRLKPYTLHFLEFYKKNYLESLNQLMTEVFNTKSVVKIASMINYYLFENLDDKFIKHLKIEKDIIDFINFNQGNLLVENIEQNFSINIRTIQRRFNKTMNITPKEYIDIVRFQSEIRKLNFLKTKKHQNFPMWFSDYSHYYKFFKRFTEKSPKDFYNTKGFRFNSIYDIY